MNDLEIQKNVVIPGWELWMTTSTSGGPGGQHANKSETRVTIHWEVESSTAIDEEQKARVLKRLESYINSDGVLQVSCAETRSQHQNRSKAREQFAELVKKGINKPKRRKKTRPTWGSKKRRLKEKRKRSRIKKLRQRPTKDDW